MSCVNPFLLVNPSKHYVPGYHQAQLMIPCGVCEGCRLDIRNEWSIRAYYEYEEAKKYNGYTLFLTFTYNDDNLPYLDNRTVFDIHQSCFDYEHIRRFNHSLRKAIKDKFSLNKDIYSFLFTCEYGGRFTKRPHYHALFHVFSDRIPYTWFLRKATDLWHYGFTYPDVNVQPWEAVVRDFTASKYVSKYICKDLDFYDKPAIKELLYLDSGKVNKENKSILRPFLPRHYQSKNYGSYLLDLINGSSDAYEFIDNGIRPYLKQDVYRVPRYILNKLCYSFVPDYDPLTGEILRDESGKLRYLRYLNDFGKKFKTHKLKNNVDTLEKRFQHNFSYLGLSTLFNDKDIQEYLLDDTQTVYTFKHTLDNLLAGRSYRDLAIYCLCAKGRELNYSDLLPLVSKVSPENIYDYVLNHFYDMENLDHASLPENECRKDILKRRVLLDTYPAFNGLSALLDLYNGIKFKKMKKKLNKISDDEVYRRNLKYQYKPH